MKMHEKVEGGGNFVLWEGKKYRLKCEMILSVKALGNSLFLKIKDLSSLRINIYINSMCLLRV